MDCLDAETGAQALDQLRHHRARSVDAAREKLVGRLGDLEQRTASQPHRAHRRRQRELREPRDMPSDAITMNSTARFRDESSGEERELTLVYPRDADGSPDRISILAPVGSALLGLRAGQSIEWPVPGGRSTRLVVLGVRYQPEAAGEYHR